MEPWNQPLPIKKMLWVFIALFAVALAFYLYFAQFPTMTYWDESIYVNASRAYLSSHKPYPNPEHPLLGKQLIAAGIRMFGDGPIGWRFSSTCFGAFSISLIAYLVWLLTERPKLAVFCALLVLFSDPLLFVHFRMGLLDPPLIALFLLSAALAIHFYLSPGVGWGKVLGLGVTLGLALSVKLLTLFIMPLCLGLVWLKLRGEKKLVSGWWKAGLLLLALPVLIVVLGYLAQGYTVKEAVDLLIFNFKWHSTAKSMDIITSRWYEWLYIGNPLWYFTRPFGEGKFEAMLATGNLILWIGAELLALYAVIRYRKRPEIIFLALMILAQFGVYIRKPHTYIHYMTEIIPFFYVLMGAGIGDLFDRYEDRYRRILQIDFAVYGILCFAVFVNYWPYVAGKPLTTEQMKATPTFKNIPLSTMKTSSQTLPASPTPKATPQ